LLLRLERLAKLRQDKGEDKNVRRKTGQKQDKTRPAIVHKTGQNLTKKQGQDKTREKEKIQKETRQDSTIQH
jgi:hypothetical protein